MKYINNHNYVTTLGDLLKRFNTESSSDRYIGTNIGMLEVIGLAPFAHNNDMQCLTLSWYDSGVENEVYLYFHKSKRLDSFVSINKLNLENEQIKHK